MDFLLSTLHSDFSLLIELLMRRPNENEVNNILIGHVSIWFVSVLEWNSFTV